MSNKKLIQANKIKKDSCGNRQIWVGLVFEINCCYKRIISEWSNS